MITWLRVELVNKAVRRIIARYGDNTYRVYAAESGDLRDLAVDMCATMPMESIFIEQEGLIVIISPNYVLLNLFPRP